ncbi:uncharacterized protein [Dysidea avara]|uniref:uncharacterized protein n=1 Tax=Dysidea avara TaxID=196820 RepID=UPI003329701D
MAAESSNLQGMEQSALQQSQRSNRMAYICTLPTSPVTSNVQNGAQPSPHINSNFTIARSVSGHPGQPAALPPVNVPYNYGDDDDAMTGPAQPFSSVPSVNYPTISQDTPKFVKIPRREADNHQYVQYKIVLFGVSKVGKTSIVDYFMYNRFEELPYHMNTAIKQEIVFLKSTETNDILKLSLWDFGHLEDLTSANHDAYNECDVAIVVFDVTIYNTLKGAKHWITQVMARVNNYPTQFLLVGNKSDLANMDNDDVNKGRLLANQFDISCYMTSAKTGQEIDTLFEKAILKAQQAKFKAENMRREAEAARQREDQSRQPNENNRRGGFCTLL